MATNQRGHFPYEGEIGVGQPVSILRLTDTPSYIPVGTPQVFCSFSIFRTSFWSVVSRFFCTNSIQTITCISERTLVKLNNVPHQTRRKA